MTRRSKAVFKMAGYAYPGTSPVTKKGGPESKQINVDDIDPVDEDAIVTKPKWYNIPERYRTAKHNIEHKKKMKRKYNQ